MLAGRQSTATPAGYQSNLPIGSGQGNLRLWASNYKLSFVKQLLSACVFLISLDLPTFLEKVLMKIEKILHTCLLHCALRCYTKSRLKPCRVEWPNLANSLLSLGNIGIAQIKSYHWKFLLALDTTYFLKFEWITQYKLHKNCVIHKWYKGCVKWNKIVVNEPFVVAFDVLKATTKEKQRHDYFNLKGLILYLAWPFPSSTPSISVRQ